MLMAAKIVSSGPQFKKTNLFVVGVVLVYFGYMWFWYVVNNEVQFAWLWTIVTSFIALFGLFSLGRAIFNE